ncbi:MAG: PD40 domain-containing protein [Anaerolineae bacterium]|nr:PD40 domain-containing protein [Anaerolineae bacterium]
MMIGIIAGLSILLLGLALWAVWDTRDGAIQPGFLYLVATSDDETQVWELEWATRHTQQIAQLPGAVLEYAVFPSIARVVYPVERADGSHDLWLLDIPRRRARRWLDCAPDDCLAVSPAPDGRSAVYTRIADGEPTLWWIQYETATTKPLFEMSKLRGHYAAWSPDGTQLAYVNSENRLCIVAWDSVTDTLCIPAQIASPPIWSPDGTQLLATDMRLETGFASHILRVDIASGEFVDLSNTFSVEDDAPAWSPDGQWIAFRRKAAGTAMGKQLWMMRADGSDSHAITADITAHYGPPIWIADSTMIVFACHRPNRAADIQAFSLNAATLQTLVSDGYLPHHLIGVPQQSPASSSNTANLRVISNLETKTRP